MFAKPWRHIFLPKKIKPLSWPCECIDAFTVLKRNVSLEHCVLCNCGRTLVHTVCFSSRLSLLVHCFAQPHGAIPKFASSSASSSSSRVRCSSAGGDAPIPGSGGGRSTPGGPSASCPGPWSGGGSGGGSSRSRSASGGGSSSTSDGSSITGMRRKRSLAAARRCRWSGRRRWCRGGRTVAYA